MSEVCIKTKIEKIGEIKWMTILALPSNFLAQFDNVHVNVYVFGERLHVGWGYASQNLRMEAYRGRNKEISSRIAAKKYLEIAELEVREALRYIDYDVALPKEQKIKEGRYIVSIEGGC